MDKKIRQRIIQARVSLILNHPFFGVLASRFILEENSNMPTMGTDGKSLHYDPRWIDSLTQTELIGIVAHETSHCAFGHPWRLGRREPERANLAMDFAIDPILTDAGFTLPSAGPNLPAGHIDPRFRNMSFEQIYDLLPPTQNSHSRCSGGTIPPGMIGQVQAPNSTEHIETLRSDWEAATLQAAQAAKMAGKLPVGLERLIDEIKHPKIDWKAVLRRFVQEAARADYTWRIPNQRYLHVGLYLPSLRSEQMPPIVLAGDTSGSIGSSEINQFGTEMQSIIDECKPERIHVMWWDTKVNRVDIFEQGEPLELNPKGGGGTAVGDVFARIERDNIEPACLIVLTDMDIRDLDSLQEPAYPTLWASTTRNYNAPFGEVIDISE